MDLNASSFYENDENNITKLNSTTVDQDAGTSQVGMNKDWTLSPINADNHKSLLCSSKLFKSPMRNSSREESGYTSRSTEKSKIETVTHDSPRCSKTEEFLNNTSKYDELDISSFIANKSKNPFDSIQYASLHKSLHFSPNFMHPSNSPEKDEKFQWSIEHLSMLKPVHFTEEELSAIHSPNPEVEAVMQEQLREYWTKNISVIPSPDGPRQVYIPARDVIADSPASQSSVKTTEDALCNLIRKKEAYKAAYATSSPKQRPRRKLRRMKNTMTQTEITIPGKSEIDLKKILGEAFVYKENGREEEEEDEFDISTLSNTSFARKLFQNDEDESFMSCEQLDESTTDVSQRFNDDLSPVRKAKEEEEDVDKHQLTLNINIMNECMMLSMNTAREEDDSMNSIQTTQIMTEISTHKVTSSILDETEFDVNFGSPTQFRADLGWTPRKRKTTLENFDMSPIVSHQTPRHQRDD